jgi:threonine synthase
VTLGALREAVGRGEVDAADRVVLLVTGDGLKTPDPVQERLQPVEIDADADALLDRLGVAVS